MKELSVFIDESGDFGEYDFRSPYYIISMVMHDQSSDINKNIEKFEESLSNLKLANNCVHAGPIIRQEEEYRLMDFETRQKILKRLMSLIRHTDINCESFYVEKKHIANDVEIAGKLGKEISRFIHAHLINRKSMI